MKVNCDNKAKELLERKSLNLLFSHSFTSVLLRLYMERVELKDIEKFGIQIILFLCFPVGLKVYLGEEDQHELYILRKHLEEDGLGETILQRKVFSSVNERMVSKSSFEEYTERVTQLTDFIKIFKPDLVSIDIDKKENGENYECDLNLNYGVYSINKEFESTGIKKLIRLFDCFTAASNGGIVFIDEMDSNLNDIYLCKLLEYFMYYGKGQLCFTTHNLDPMSVLKENKNSIDFLSSDNHLFSWTSRGNATPENSYRNGLIKDLPFNIDATDFVGIFGE